MQEPHPVAVGFIGAGTVGKALAWSIDRAAAGSGGLSWRVAAVASRTRTSAEALSARVSGCVVYDSPQDVADRAGLVFITTPDAVIPQVVEQVTWRPGQWVVHCSGADSVLVLEPARRAGAKVGVAHPLLPFASAERALDDLPGATFALEGEGTLLTALQEMATALDCRWVVLQTDQKVLYHAAAVLASNYLVTLVKLATDLWGEFGVDQAAATAALIPLVRGTLHNLTALGLPAALTGPVSRGDSETVRKHLAALTDHAPALLAVYRELGLQTLPIALDKGRLTKEQECALRTLLEGKAALAGNQE